MCKDFKTCPASKICTVCWPNIYINYVRNLFYSSFQYLHNLAALCSQRITQRARRRTAPLRSRKGGKNPGCDQIVTTLLFSLFSTTIFFVHVWRPQFSIVYFGCSPIWYFCVFCFFAPLNESCNPPVVNHTPRGVRLISLNQLPVPSNVLLSPRLAVLYLTWKINFIFFIHWRIWNDRRIC